MARSHHSGYTSTAEPLARKVAVLKGGDASYKMSDSHVVFQN